MHPMRAAYIAIALAMTALSLLGAAWEVRKAIHPRREGKRGAGRAGPGQRAGKAPLALRAPASFGLGASAALWIAFARGEGLVEGLFWASMAGLLLAVLPGILGRAVSAFRTESIP